MEGMGKEAYLRLKRVLLNDKNLPGGLLTVLRSDLTSLLNSYFDFGAENLDIDITIDAEGRYKLKVELPIERVKPLRIL